MSRESDLQALQSIKDEIVEIYNLNEKCRTLSEECEKLSKQASSPEPFSFERIPENEHEKLKAEYDRQWKEKHQGTNKISRIFLILNTVIIAAISLLIIADVCFHTGIIIKPDMALKLTEAKLSENIIAVLAQAGIAVLLIALPWKLMRRVEK